MTCGVFFARHWGSLGSIVLGRLHFRFVQFLNLRGFAMNMLFIGIAAIASLAATGASAADLAPRMYAKAHIIPPVIYDWTGSTSAAMSAIAEVAQRPTAT
jgi:hypothetical protein